MLPKIFKEIDLNKVNSNSFMKRLLPVLALLTSIAHFSERENILPTEEAEETENRSPIECTVDQQTLKEYALAANLPALTNPFVDTKRPNAVVVYPCIDVSSRGHINRSFYWRSGGTFLRDLFQAYDVSFTIAKTEQDFYDALDTTPDIATVVVAGHGTRRSLRFSGDVDGTNDEARTLDISDQEVSQHFSNLRPDVRWYNRACNNGRGGEDANNLGNMIRYHLQNHSPSTYSFFSTQSARGSDIEMMQTFPLHIRIIRDGRDFTYTNAPPLCILGDE